MFDIKKGTLPNDALLQRYAETDGGYTDCYYTEIDGAISLSSFTGAFYTTPLFKLERIILKYFVSKPSTDQQVRELGDGQIDHFAAWRVEQRTNNQLLMCDFAGRTLSWFMIAPDLDQNKDTTRLYFGTAIVPRASGEKQKPSIGFAFRAMLGFHKLYSVALLSAARARLNRSPDHRTNSFFRS